MPHDRTLARRPYGTLYHPFLAAAHKAIGRGTLKPTAAARLLRTTVPELRQLFVRHGIPKMA